MAKELLTADQAMTKRDGRYRDGGGLWLIVRNHGHAGSYFFEFNGDLVGEKGWQHVSLGPRKKISLAKARNRAELCQQLLDKGLSPKHWKRHEQKAVRAQEGASLTVGEAIEGRADPLFEGFRQWATGRVWKRPSTITHARWIIDGYFKPSKLWDMPVQDVEPEHTAKFLDPCWFPKRDTAKRMQSFGFSLFRWLKHRKYYDRDNPFCGEKDAPMVDLLGGPQSPGGHWKDPEPDDLPLVMAYLRKPRPYADDEWTAAEVAEASGRDIHVVRLACRGRGKTPPVFPNAYRWAPWGTAPWIIPDKDLHTPQARKMFPVKRPLRQHQEIAIESLATQFVLLTVVRPDMACQLREEFINERRGLITYPKGKHKTGERTNDEYNVVHTPHVKEVLDAARAYKKRHGINSRYLFVKGRTRTGRDIHSDELVKKATLWRAFKTLLARIPDIEKRDATLHAVRDSHTEWVCDRNKLTSLAVAKVALGHTIPGITNKGYFKNVTFQAEIEEIETRWQNFLLQVSPSSLDVIPFRSEPTPLDKEGKPLRPWQLHTVK